MKPKEALVVDGSPVPVPEPATAPQPKCPYCKANLEEIGWLKNEQEGLITFFHNAPGCQKVINIQAVPVERRVVQPAGLIRSN